MPCGSRWGSSPSSSAALVGGRQRLRDSHHGHGPRTRPAARRAPLGGRARPLVVRRCPCPAARVLANAGHARGQWTVVDRSSRRRWSLVRGLLRRCRERRHSWSRSSGHGRSRVRPVFCGTRDARPTTRRPGARGCLATARRDPGMGSGLPASARVARGDPDPQCRRADGEFQWGIELDCLAVDAGMHSRWGLDRQVSSLQARPGGCCLSSGVSSTRIPS